MTGHHLTILTGVALGTSVLKVVLCRTFSYTIDFFLVVKTEDGYTVIFHRHPISMLVPFHLCVWYNSI